jgi:hypothetical protein
MGAQKQTKVTAWLALPAGWEKTHWYYKSKKRKKKPTHSTNSTKIFNQQRTAKPKPTKHLKYPTTTNHHSTIQSSWNEVAALFQCNLREQRLIDADLLPFGDHQKPKNPNHYWIEQHNINNIPENGNTFKSQTLV